MKPIEIPVFFTDAGPPPSFEYLFVWTLLLAVSFAIFGVARSAVRVAESLPAVIKETGQSMQWWVRQLHLCMVSWLLFYVVHRLFAYVLLPSQVLGRLHMLPLSDGVFGRWVGVLRPAIFCGESDRSDDGSCADGELPLGVVASDTTTGKWAGSMRNEEWRQCQYVALAAFVTTMCIVLSVCNAFSCFLLQVCNDESDGTEDDTTSEEVISSGSDEELWWDMGEPDDACLTSPEAESAEERWREMAVEERSAQRCQNKQSGMGDLLQTCWPVLLAVSYAGLYAHTGSMPLLMRWVYPSCVMMVTLFAMTV
ncbi:hypothetical protein DQ04_01211070 [Trypanosoma grayi]|uniref:hypothetical protein n=1 Tax=Trypanosoma grayi TaxID=71804 RepID=UPI0004F49560|nr:hypothetical protein DQ04_01211070 [Trypanosoma grayi]KEG13108.1 hypothetical protein DQ04_01211070 [Trypanosoma grayi]